MIIHPPIPETEIERLMSLSALDLDYTALEGSLQDLTRLAACIAGTSISLVNLIDTYTQWSVSKYGLPLEQMTREESVCQYTILEEQYFEVKDLSADDRFKNRHYVKGALGLKYYFGIPLKMDDGQNIGALCVLDKNTKTIDTEKGDLLKIIAKEIVIRLKSDKLIETLTQKIIALKETQNKLAHDLRGPIGGLTSIAKLYKRQVYTSNPEKVAAVFNMIEDSGNCLLHLAEEILNNNNDTGFNNKIAISQHYNLASFKDAIEKLYLPMAKSKELEFAVVSDKGNEDIAFAKTKLLQIAGNLISNAIKFTPAGGQISVSLGLQLSDLANTLFINVQDNGRGISQDAINKITKGLSISTTGTSDEHGYGFGLTLVRRLVRELKGKIKIFSSPGQGSKFEIQIPQRNDCPVVSLPRKKLAPVNNAVKA